MEKGWWWWWMVLGDFDEIAAIEEQSGASLANPIKCLKFREVLDSCNLLDLGSTGPRFAWIGSRSGSYNRVFKRLDRAVRTSNWRICFSDAVVRVLPGVKSDHHPHYD
ncbi:hypothetical protein CRG98_039181 [Punica granatum]|uniref:Endonuclease/exonuclease/phosphatase domain-containing protein n=1 Tax=Punica granatum TaxID=22663 RepID=A0A2I0I8U2_PUNGR|nr:hypothetical protein CRG98_039181 [Punica granatum]